MSEARDGGADSISLPIALVDKAPARTTDYDLIGPSDESLTFPTLETSIKLSAAILDELVRVCSVPGRYPSASQLERLKRGIECRGRRVDRPHKVDAAAALRELRSGEWLAEEARPRFARLASMLIDRAVVAVPVPARTTASVVKFRFTAHHGPLGRERERRARAGLAPFPLQLRFAGWECQSSHVEIVTPDGVEILGAELRGFDVGGIPDGDAGDTVQVYAIADGSTLGAGGADGFASADPIVDGQRAHLYVYRPPATSFIELVVHFRAARSGFLSAAAWVSCISAGIAIFASLCVPQMRDNADTSGALLLVIPAFGAAFVTQYGQHAVAALMLTTVRRAVYCVAVLGLLSCALLISYDVSGREAEASGWCEFGYRVADRLPWVLIAGASTWLAALVFLARRLPARSGEVRRTHKLLEWATRPVVRVLWFWPRFWR